MVSEKMQVSSVTRQALVDEVLKVIDHNEPYNMPNEDLATIIVDQVILKEIRSVMVKRRL